MDGATIGALGLEQAQSQNLAITEEEMEHGSMRVLMRQARLQTKLLLIIACELTGRNIELTDLED